MNWEAVGAIAEAVGAVAVLVTLVYLASQIRQNTKSLKATATQAIMSETTSTYAALAFDEEMSRIYWSGLQDFWALNQSDRRRFATYMASTMKPWENILAQVRLGTVDHETMEGGRSELIRHFSQPGMRQWWTKGESAFSNELVEWVETEILPNCTKMDTH